MKEEKSKEIQELKDQVESLKSELCASIRREELLRGEQKGIKARIKRTKLWRMAADSKSALGRLVRLPKTIMNRPKQSEEAISEKEEEQSLAETDEKKNLLPPIHFLSVPESRARINVIVESIDSDLLKIGTKIANEEKKELRIVLTKESMDSVKYGQLVSQKKVPKANEVSFYSVPDQELRVKRFDLEVSDKDIFITRAWKNED